MLPTGTRSAILAALLIGWSSAVGATPQAKQPSRVNASAAAVQGFLKRVAAYVALHKKLEDTLPTLPEQTTPQVIDTHQRTLAALIQAARKDAKQGDLLIPAMQQHIRAVLRPVFSGAAGRQLKAEIMDNEVKDVTLKVNGRYPDEVPISTVPPQVLLVLPKLPEELEYRFIKHSLILFDPHAHIIVDYMDRAVT